ncbi:sulfate ABC transporter permease subunit [uncultured Jatrophihabitans sp.]|uniref:sulfate ABC transporter permease subunit n=1 Tax=uncultured Jatrophihabitans sp. TaxID=1610747 RepID=UPI0035CC575C
MADVAIAPATTATAPAPPVARNRGPASWTLRLIAVLYVGVLALVPVVVILYRTFKPGLSEFFDALSNHNALHAFEVSAIVAGIAVVINTVFGVGVGILLARHRFPGKRLLSAFVDLPVAVSPIVVGLALLLVYGPSGWFGPTLDDHGFQVIYAKPGMVLATVFVSLPLVVRAVVPVLEQAGTDQEQAASSLGANAVARFLRITLPTIRVALTYGVVLSLARCLGEYGAVLVVSGNIEGQTETAPLRISNLLENEQDPNGAYAITFVLIVVAFLAIVAGAWIRRRGRV